MYYELDIDKLADNDINNNEYDASEEIQSGIDNDLYFKYNSVNLVIGKRGSGKTYMVMREMLKLAHQMKIWNMGAKELDADSNPRYTQIYYITDKLRDDTCERMRYYIEKLGLQFIWEKTENALEIIQYVSAIKAFLADPSQYKEELQTPDFIQQCREALNINPIALSDAPLPHTVIIFDDCIGLFNKHSPLSKKLFENRQSRITYFLILQDVQGISPSMKANVDSLVFFGGFPKHKWNSLMYQMPVVDSGYTYEGFYHWLKASDFVLFDYIDNRIYHKKRGEKEYILVFDSKDNKSLQITT